ncbi:MAG TPA: outer membrane beta-barrel protein, partial [Puia sp.]|nr:outer membrane beta-barrel protein [Puia sp.]
NYSSSEISPGFSFDAGAFVNKNLSKRISFSAGINYHYYSTRIRTGMKINTALGTYNSMGQPIRATSYYENGQSETFTNQYHFIELPLSVNFQIIKSKKTPLIWELGVTPGYIVSSDALYYDPNTNVYFSKYLQPNKMQINGTTALMIGLPLYKGELQVGPQLQYGFTGFVNTNDGNPGHLFYVGLKISFIPGKK